MSEKPIIGKTTSHLDETTLAAPEARRVGQILRQLLLRGGPLIALILLAAYLSFASPHFFTVSNLINVSRQTSITAILAVGQTLVILSAGIDLSVASIAALSASVSAVLMTQQVEFAGLTIGPINFWLGLLIALLVGTLAGFINGTIITRGRIPDFIATLGTLATFRGIALLVTGGLPVPSHLTATALGGYLPDQLIWLGGGDIFGVPVAALIAVGIGVLGWFILRYTALGRAIFAVGGNREAARVSGINIDRTKVVTYTLAGFMAGVAGIVLTGRLNSANALMADGEELRSIASVVIGGTNLFGGEGGAVGSLIGALIMGVLGNGLNLLNVSAFWQRVIQGLVIILVVVFDQWRRRRFAS
jgi:ribose/xylose/arabinose/galactoside ABC-type transport system permease subunit